MQHGAVISDNASALGLGLIYMFYRNIRVGIEVRYGFAGVDIKTMQQFQFAWVPAGRPTLGQPGGYGYEWSTSQRQTDRSPHQAGFAGALKGRASPQAGVNSAVQRARSSF